MDKPLISDHWHDWDAHPIPVLPGMNGDDLWILMRLFLGDQSGHSYTREALFEQLTKIDFLKRPLIAAFLADARSKSDRDFSTIEEVLDDYLRLEEKRYWKPVSGGDLSRDKCLLVLATIAGGVSVKDAQAEGFPKTYRDTFESMYWDEARFKAYGGKPEGGGYLPKMEPDILGEYFVLSNYGMCQIALQQLLEYTVKESSRFIRIRCTFAERFSQQ